MTIPRPPHADLLAVTLDRARRIVERAQAEGERLSIGEALGFTREDVQAIRDAAREIEAEWFTTESGVPPLATVLFALAEKVEALLPAEGT